MPRILLIDDDAQLGPPLAAYFARFDLETPGLRGCLSVMVLINKRQKAIPCVSPVPSMNPIIVRRQDGSCPPAWCNWRWGTAFAGQSRAGQLAIAGRLTVGSSLIVAMVSSVM